MTDPVNIYGPMRHGGEIEDALIARLKAWMPTYLAEMDRRFNLTEGLSSNVIPHPKSYVTVNQFTSFPEDRLPTAIVIAPGLLEEPQMKGDGSYRARWAWGVAIIVSARTGPEAKRLAKVHAAAVRACVLQDQSLGGVVAGSGWVNERYDDIPDSEDRSLSAGQVVGWADLEGVVSAKYGPKPDATPAPDPTVDPGQWPTILTTDIIIDNITEGG